MTEFDEVYKIISENISLPNEVYESAKKVWELTGKYRHCYKLHWAMACFFFAIRTSTCLPITLKEFAGWFFEYYREYNFDVLVRHISRYYHFLIKEFEISPKSCYCYPQMYVKYYGERLGLDKRSIGFALRLANEIQKRKLAMGRQREIVAGAILYIVALEKNLNINQFEISKLVKYTEVSIRKVYHSLIVNLKDFCPNAFEVYKQINKRWMKDP
jgi:transcription initiation factor TFIIIB Brf1 subunit/transcription initiation factor TFIIB